MSGRLSLPAVPSVHTCPPGTVCELGRSYMVLVWYTAAVDIVLM